MRRCYISDAITLLLALSVVGAELHAKIEAKPGIVSLGEFGPNQVAKASVLLRNVGDTDDQVYSVEPGCSCTVATFDRRILKPGAEQALDISVETRNYSGEMRRVVSIFTATGNLNVLIKLSVKSAALIAPPPLPVAIPKPSPVKSEGGQLTVVSTSRSTENVKDQQVDAGAQSIIKPQMAKSAGLRVTPRFLKLSAAPSNGEGFAYLQIENWPSSQMPKFLLGRGTVVALDGNDSLTRYRVSVPFEQPGRFTGLLQILDGDRLIMEIPVTGATSP